jgi:hypothetical protein
MSEASPHTPRNVINAYAAETKRPLRVLNLINSLDNGGSEHFLLNLGNPLTRHGIESHAVCVSPAAGLSQPRKTRT